MQVATVFADVRAGGLLRGVDRAVVLVSGGRDSVCLLDVVRRLCGAGGVVACHVNYCLAAPSRTRTNGSYVSSANA